MFIENIETSTSKNKGFLSFLLYWIRCLGFGNLISLIAFLIISTIILFVPINNLDELWNYNFANAIANGLIPYKDISMLQTPLSAYLGAIFLKLFGGGLFAFRIATYTLLLGTQISFYFLSLKITKSNALAFTLTSFVFALNMFCFYYNYNNLSLYIVLLILLYDLSKESTYRKSLIEGLMFGVLPIIKQSTGLVLLLVFFAKCIYKVCINKITVRKCSLLIFISLVPSMLLIGLLIVNKSFKYFYEYAIIGVSTFTHQMKFLDFILSNPISFVLGICTILTFSYIVVVIIKRRLLFSKKTFCLIVSIMWLVSVTYPIFDLAHFIVGTIPFIAICFMFLEHKTIRKNEKTILYIIACAMLTLSCVFIVHGSDDYKISDLNKFKGITIEKKLESNIKIINSYIIENQDKGKKVLIADATAAIYNIPLNIYNKNWDMLLVGNVGINTTDELLNQNKDAVILVPKNNLELNKQSHFELIEYIKESYLKIDEVLYFDVYEKK